MAGTGPPCILSAPVQQVGEAKTGLSTHAHPKIRLGWACNILDYSPSENRGFPPCCPGTPPANPDTQISNPIHSRRLRIPSPGPPERRVQVLIPGVCECDHIWKRGSLQMWVKNLNHPGLTGGGALSSGTRVFTRGDATEERPGCRPRAGGRGWAACPRGFLAAPEAGESQCSALSWSLWRGHGPADTLSLNFWPPAL